MMNQVYVWMDEFNIILPQMYILLGQRKQVIIISDVNTKYIRADKINSISLKFKEALSADTLIH